MKIMNKSTASLLSTLVICLGLASCAAPIIVGGVIGGAMVASDRRTTGIQVEDEMIEQRSATAIRENFGSKEHVNITNDVRIMGEKINSRMDIVDDRQLEMYQVLVDGVPKAAARKGTERRQAARKAAQP